MFLCRSIKKDSPPKNNILLRLHNTVLLGSVPFAGLLAGLKLAGLSPAKCPAESPAKKTAPQKSKIGPPNSSQLASAIFARPHYEWNVFNNTWIRYFNHNMAGPKSPQWAWRSLGVRFWIFVGRFFFAGLSAGHFEGLSPASFSPEKSPAKGTEPNVWQTSQFGACLESDQSQFVAHLESEKSSVISNSYGKWRDWYRVAKTHRMPYLIDHVPQIRH